MARRCAELLLATASLAASLLALEGWARWQAAHSGGGRERNERALYTRFDDTLGWTLRPGARVLYQRPEYTVEVAINSLGLRDPERSDTTPGTFRVLALGDSFVEGYTVALEHTLTQVLERRLRRDGCPLEVWNAGVGGYSTDQEYLLYERLRVDHAPQVVLLFFYYNDVLLNARHDYFGAAKPLLRKRKEGLVPENAPLPPPQPRARGDDEAGSGYTPNERSRSALFEFVRERLMHGAPRTYNQLAAWGLWARLRGQQPPETLHAYELGRSPSMWHGWSVVGQVLEALRDETAARGARLLAVYVPARFEVDERDWEFQRAGYSLDQRGFDRVAVERRLRRLSARVGVDFLSLVPALRRVHGFWTPVYFPRDGHWNAYGHRAAAAAVEQRLRERGWLPRCASP